MLFLSWWSGGGGGGGGCVKHTTSSSGRSFFADELSGWLERAKDEARLKGLSNQYLVINRLI